MERAMFFPLQLESKVSSTNHRLLKLEPRIMLMLHGTQPLHTHVNQMGLRTGSWVPSMVSNPYGANS
jgi:hypothetical protein